MNNNFCNPWSDAEKIIATELFEAGYGYAAIADAMKTSGFDRSKNSVKGFVRHGLKTGITAKRFCNKYITTDESFSSLSDKHLRSIKEIASQYTETKYPKVTHGIKNQSLILVLSDLHIGKKSILNGKTVYDLSIAQERIKTLTNNFLSMYYNYIKKEAIVNEVVIVIAGDIVDGELIYETQRSHIEIDVVKQLQCATVCLWNFLAQISDIDPNIPVRVVCVRGNHGRTHDSANEESNWDLALYYNLRILANVAGRKNVYLEISDSDYALFDVKGHKGLVRHIAPYESRNAASKAKLGGWLAQHEYDFLICGHWHSTSFSVWNGRPMFCNGCLSGTDDLAERIALSSDPVQWVFGISEKRLPTFMYRLDCSV